jgi:hypothetical protein
MKTSVYSFSLFLMFSVLLTLGIWSCSSPCPECPESLTGGAIIAGPCSISLQATNPIRFKHFDSAGNPVREGTEHRPASSPIHVVLENGDKFYFIENGIVNVEAGVLMEVQEGADHLIGLELPYAHQNLETCVNGEPLVAISGRIIFPGIANPPLPADITVLDGVHPSTRFNLNTNYAFSGNLLRDVTTGSNCKVSLRILYPNGSGNREIRTSFTNLTDLSEIKVVLGDRVKDNSSFDSKPDVEADPTQ